MEYFFKMFLHLQTLSLLCFLIILHFAFAQCCHHHKFVSHLGWAPSFSFFFFFLCCLCFYWLWLYFVILQSSDWIQPRTPFVMWYLSFQFLFEFSLCLPRLLCYSLSSLTCSLSFSLCTLLFFLSLSSLLFVWESSLKLPPLDLLVVCYLDEKRCACLVQWASQSQHIVSKLLNMLLLLNRFGIFLSNCMVSSHATHSLVCSPSWLQLVNPCRPLGYPSLA